MSDMKAVLNSLQTTIACDVRDWSLDKRSAWIWGVLVGWDEDDGTPCKYENRPDGLEHCPEEDFNRMNEYHAIVKRTACEGVDHG